MKLRKKIKKPFVFTRTRYGSCTANTSLRVYVRLASRIRTAQFDVFRRGRGPGARVLYGAESTGQVWSRQMGHEES